MAGKNAQGLSQPRRIVSTSATLGGKGGLRWAWLEDHPRTCNWLGSPPFISRLAYLEGEYPYLGDLLTGMILQVAGPCVEYPSDFLTLKLRYVVDGYHQKSQPANHRPWDVSLKTPGTSWGFSLLVPLFPQLVL